jgi:hypothetical protein
MDAGRCWLRLTNGWTVSISQDDTPPALCSVAAWRTRQDNQRLELSDYFDFGEDRRERRCWNLADIREALAIVGAAKDVS